MCPRPAWATETLSGNKTKEFPESLYDKQRPRLLLASWPIGMYPQDPVLSLVQRPHGIIAQSSLSALALWLWTSWSVC